MCNLMERSEGVETGLEPSKYEPLSKSSPMKYLSCPRSLILKASWRTALMDVNSDKLFPAKMTSSTYTNNNVMNGEVLLMNEEASKADCL